VIRCSAGGSAATEPKVWGSNPYGRAAGTPPMGQIEGPPEMPLSRDGVPFLLGLVGRTLAQWWPAGWWWPVGRSTSITNGMDLR
jgi:hypothetical protein